MPNPLTRLWSPVEVRATLPVAPDVVFDVLAEPRTYPEWLVGAKAIRAVDADFPEPGSEFHHTVGGGPVAVEDSTEVLLSERPDRLRLRLHLGKLDGDVDFLVLAAPEGTEVRMRERPVGIPALATPLLRVSLHARNAESLRQLREFLADDRADGDRPAEAAAS